MYNRSMAMVIRDGRILLEKLHFDNRTFYSIPGGGIEMGETPEAAAIRELKEECGVDGTIIRKLTAIYKPDGSMEHVFYVSIPYEQTPVIGYDPEMLPEDQVIKDVCWMKLEEMSERDRAFMFAYGILETEDFFKKIIRWGDEISLPGTEKR